MKAEAVAEYNPPKYPTKQAVSAKPSLLRQCVSEERRRFLSAGLSGALLATISLAGCKDEPAGPAALVAPIFEHGQGRGATGCVVVAPPAFLSEEEALVVIKEELAKHGVTLEKRKVLLKEVKITPGRDGRRSSEQPRPTPVEMDIQDTRKNIAVEYVDQHDYFVFGGNSNMSTAQSYDTKKVAVNLRDKLQYHGKGGIYGVFYDPMTTISVRPLPEDKEMSREERLESYGVRWRDAKKDATNSAKVLLRSQVQDFAKWLQEQEVI